MSRLPGPPSPLPDPPRPRDRGSDPRPLRPAHADAGESPASAPASAAPRTIRIPRTDAQPHDASAADGYDRRFLTPQQLVDRYRGTISRKTLATWRHTGAGPAYTKIGSTRVLYAAADVLRWELARREVALRQAHARAAAYAQKRTDRRRQAAPPSSSTSSAEA